MAMSADTVAVRAVDEAPLHAGDAVSRFPHLGGG